MEITSNQKYNQFLTGIGLALSCSFPLTTHIRRHITFLLIESKELTKIVSLTGNDLGTSGLLYSAMFCINQKNAFLICNSSVFIPHCLN